MSKFFVLGLPRSRTYWLSEFLGCLHEACWYYDDYNDFMDSDYIGDSTTVYPYIKNHLEGYKKVVIERDLNDVYESSSKLFDGVDINGLMVFKEELDGIDDCLRVKYEDINDRLKDIWEYCRDEPFDEERAEKMKMIHLENDSLIREVQSCL